MREISCLVVLLVFATSGVSAAEHPVALKDLPAPVQATVKAETAGSTINGLSKEVEHGVTLYEVETNKDGLSRDLLINKDGVLVEVEEQIALDAAPPAVQKALSQQGQLLKLERVTSHGTTTYEAHLQKAGKKPSVTLDQDGRVVAPN
jgi:hypothetical protein